LTSLIVGLTDISLYYDDCFGVFSPVLQQIGQQKQNKPQQEQSADDTKQFKQF
jgi:hypothetical protein